MTLEDFFTLTEMKDGLTAPARVKELVNVMQKEKDCVVKNVCDATRQWATVASTIAATEDKDCLDLFVQLDGPLFIDRWLKDAQKFGNETSDSFVEESITVLLHALEKLSIDYKKSISFGIWMTVKNLLGHSSSRVQERARGLFDGWKRDGNSEAVPQDVEKVGASCTDGEEGSGNLAGEVGRTECSTGDIALSGVGANKEKHVEPARNEMIASICSDVVQPEKVDDVQIQTSDKECSSDPAGLSMLKPVTENHTIKEDSPPCHSGGTASIETGTSVIQGKHVEGKSDVHELNEHTDEPKQIQRATSPPNKVGSAEISVSSPVEPRSLLVDPAAIAQESVTQPDLQHSDTKDKGCPKDSSTGEVEMDMSEGRSRMDDNVSLDSSGNEGKLQGGPDSSFSTGDSGELAKGHVSDESEDLENDSDLLKPAVDVKDPDVVDKRRSDLELDYGMVDALEVARQVAIEVEREVVHRREPSCSSSEKISEGGIRQPGSPESIYGKEIQPIEAASKEVPTGPGLSAELSAKGEELLSSAKVPDAGTENCVQDLESSQVTEAAQEPEIDTEKGLGDFDLNQEVGSEDMDQPAISTPISIVSASRAAVVPGLPVAPLQFEGAHGWKGSAATSAFHSASPRRTLEGDKILTIGGSQSSLKRQVCLDIDLNVAEVGDDTTAGKQILAASGPSGESSGEANPRRSVRLELDLNQMSDDRDALADWRIEGQLFHHKNGHRTPSPSSSSSSMQPVLRNIDLNDRPLFSNDSSGLLQQPYLGKSLQSVNAPGVLKPRHSVISILGTRVAVNQNDFLLQTPSLPNGRVFNPALDVNLARSAGFLGMGSAVSYGHPPVLGYNSLTAGLASTFSAATYGPTGPIPYRFDPVAPQIMGNASTSAVSYSRPPFIMSMTGTPPGSNGGGPSRPNFDLNSSMVIEGGNRECGGSRQLFNPGQTRSIDEHVRAANSQPSTSSGADGKRKEPDGGWEVYPFNYKLHQPSWK